MKYVYYILEKNEETDLNEDEGFVVYDTFEKAVSVSKELLLQEFNYIESSYDDMDLEKDFIINNDKEICEASIYNEDEVIYRLSVKKIPVIS